MVFFIFAREEWIPDVQLIEDAAKRPHVNRLRVGDPQHDLWRSVKPRLDVGVDLLVLEAPAAEVNDFDSGLVDLAKKDIFRFQIAMDHLVFFHKVKADQDLNRKPFNQAQRETLEVVHFDEVVQVD